MTVITSYTHQENETFVYCWQTSSTIAELTTRLRESPDFRDEYVRPACYVASEQNPHVRTFRPATTVPLNTKWASNRAGTLRRRGVGLKRLPATTMAAQPASPLVDYDALHQLATDLAD